MITNTSKVYGPFGGEGGTSKKTQRYLQTGAINASSIKLLGKKIQWRREEGRK